MKRLDTGFRRYDGPVQNGGRCRIPAWVATVLFLFFSLSASAGICEGFHNALSLQGFTGLLNTPNAEVTDEGKACLLYSNQIEDKYRNRTKREESYMFSVGFFSFAEIGGRLTESPGVMRDLSANFKVKVPFIPKESYLPQVAFGMQDVGGGAKHLQTKYMVASEELGRLRFSLGYGSGPDRMDGLFGGVELKTFDWLYLIGEHDTREKNVGIRLVTPDLFGLPVNLHATAKTSLDYRAGHMEYGIGLQIPLGLDERKKAVSAKLLTEEPAEHGEAVPGEAKPAGYSDADGGKESSEFSATLDQSSYRRKPVSSSFNTFPIMDTGLRLLRKRLIADGFRDVRVGADVELTLLVVEYENVRYSHNELDALAVVARLAADTVSPAFEMIQLVAKKKGISILQISFPVEDFKEFQRDAGYMPQFNAVLDISTDVKVDEAVRFIDGDTNPSWLNSELVLYPGLKTFVGTEVGLFDYLLSVKPDYYLNLWKGAVLNARWDIPVAWSENFNDGKAYRYSRDDRKLERVMLFQAIKVAPDVMLNVGAGRVLEHTRGTADELMWTPGNGNHRFALKYVYLKSSDLWAAYQDNESWLASYRYYFAPLDIYLKGTAGQFLDRDRGFTVELKRFFGDTAFSLYYKNTWTEARFRVPRENYQMAGVQIALPLTPRREMKPVAKMQVKGSNDWNYLQETRVGSIHNDIGASTGLDPVMGYNLERFYYNRDRLNEDYIRRHLLRLKNDICPGDHTGESRYPD